MPPRRSPSVIFVVLAQIAMYVALPLACCVSSTEPMTADTCPHETEPGAQCPMHASPHHEAGDPDATTFRRCGSDEPLLRWLDVPVAPPEHARPVHVNVVWEPMPLPLFDRQIPPGVDPPSPPPRA